MKFSTRLTIIAISFSLLSLVLPSCQKGPKSLDPRLDYTPSPEELSSLPSLKNFAPVHSSEDWTKEYHLGLLLAKEQDYYRAITAFKRALYSNPSKDKKSFLIYNIALCYYLGGKYDLALETIEKLSSPTPKWPLYQDYLILLHHCYQKSNQKEKAEAVQKKLFKVHPSISQKLSLSSQILEGRVQNLQPSPKSWRWLEEYERKKKDPTTAQVLNAILPGSGYLYLGQRMTAFTSFALNTLFIAASWKLFDHKHYAAGAIVTGLEFGWYFGGIYGGGLSAQQYNRSLFEKKAHPFLKKEKLYPSLLFRYAF